MRITTTSSLIPRNGLDTLIQACKLLDIDWRLTIAGDGPEKERLKKLAANLPVKFLGRVENTKIPQLLKKHDLFIRPSRFEGFGSSFIEAMAAGLPIIGTPVGGIVDFLTDNKTGFLVPVDNPTALAKKIEYVNSHPEIAKAVAKRGQDFVVRNYSWDKIAKEVFDQFRQLAQ